MHRFYLALHATMPAALAGSSRPPPSGDQASTAMPVSIARSSSPSHSGSVCRAENCGWVLASLPAHWMFVMLGAFVVAGGVFYRLGAALPVPPRQA